MYKNVFYLEYREAGLRPPPPPPPPPPRRLLPDDISTLTLVPQQRLLLKNRNNIQLIKYNITDSVKLIRIINKLTFHQVL